MRQLLLLILPLLLPVCLFSQITITTDDMPKSGLSLPMANASAFSLQGYDKLGANQTWNYSNLNKFSTHQLDYLTPMSVGLINWIFFWGSTVAWYPANPQSFAILTPDSLVDFYDNSTNSFTYMGFGASFNGFPIPVRYQDDDVVYELPMHYGDQFSDNSHFDFTIPQTFYFEEYRTRSTTVDGWGTLKLPSGSYDVLHLKIDLTKDDSLYIDSTGAAINVPPTHDVIYQWWGKNIHVPLLEVTTTTFFGFPFVNSVVYYDGPSLASADHLLESEFQFYPNPAKEKVLLEANSPLYSARILDLQGKELAKFDLKGKMQTSISVNEIPEGVYLLKVSGEMGESTEKLLICR